MIPSQEVSLVKRSRCLILFIVIIGFTALITGCGSDKGDVKTGTVSIGLTDATTDEYQAVYVTINEVQVHRSGGSWETVGYPGKTYNLLELVNGIIEQLGIIQLEAGTYTQVRLIIGDDPEDELNILGASHLYANYIIDTADNIHELKVPSGYNTGIKLVHGFSINEGAMVELVLDFDACKSVVKAGNSGKWLLKPTIKVIDFWDAYLISGTVSGVSDNPMEGVLVSAQVFDGSAVDKKDEVTIQSSTITDEDGNYIMLVEPGVYNIMAYQDGYSPSPDCVNVIVESVSSGPISMDFILDSTMLGTVSGNVEIENGGAEATANLSFRQDIQCENLVAPEAIEIKSIPVLNEDAYSGVTLPAGTYTLVASSEGRITQVIGPVEIIDGVDTKVDIAFPQP